MFTDVSEKKIVMSNLATKTSALKKVEKELSDTKKELANPKQEVENLTRQLQQDDSRPSRGVSIKCYCEKERIKFAVFEEKAVISCRNKVNVE